MVDFLEHSLSYHIAQELAVTVKDESVSIEESLVRAFLMADVHSKEAGIKTSGATVAVCLVKVCIGSWSCQSQICLFSGWSQQRSSF